MKDHKIYSMAVSSVYPHYLAKIERKGKTKEEVDDLIMWLTGYSQSELDEIMNSELDFRDFFDQAPSMNPNASLVSGKICGITVEEIENPLMKNIRILDKIIDELAKGRKMDKIKRI